MLSRLARLAPRAASRVTAAPTLGATGPALRRTLTAHAHHQQTDEEMFQTAKENARKEDQRGKGEKAFTHEDGRVTYGGLTLRPPVKWEVHFAQLMGGFMYFWLLYRFKNDYRHFLGLDDTHSAAEMVQLADRRSERGETEGGHH